MDISESSTSQDLRDFITTSKTAQPILHHLNADSSWLVQIPYPESTLPKSGRKYFNIVLDPWLTGPQSDVASWFSKQSHAIAPAYGSIAAVEALCWEVESIAGGKEIGTEESPINMVAISHEFTDHCHQETLLQLSPSTPIFANDKAITLLKSWKHFTNIHETPAFKPDWLSTSTASLPPFLSLSRLQSQSDFLYYHSALIIAFQSPSSPEQGECIIYTPHGLPTTKSNPFAAASPPLKTLALLHGLHDVSIPWTPLKSGTQQLNLGAHNALKLQRQIQSRYWITTHDEVKKGGGLVGFILRRKVITLEDALDAEEEKGEEAKVIELPNGKGMVLI